MVALDFCVRGSLGLVCTWSPWTCVYVVAVDLCVRGSLGLVCTWQSWTCVYVVALDLPEAGALQLNFRPPKPRLKHTNLGGLRLETSFLRTIIFQVCTCYIHNKYFADSSGVVCSGPGFGLF